MKRIAVIAALCICAALAFGYIRASDAEQACKREALTAATPAEIDQGMTRCEVIHE